MPKIGLFSYLSISTTGLEEKELVKRVATHEYILLEKLLLENVIYPKPQAKGHESTQI